MPRRCVFISGWNLERTISRPRLVPQPPGNSPQQHWVAGNLLPLASSPLLSLRLHAKKKAASFSSSLRPRPNRERHKHKVPKGPPGNGHKHHFPSSSSEFFPVPTPRMQPAESGSSAGVSGDPSHQAVQDDRGSVVVGDTAVPMTVVEGAPAASELEHPPRNVKVREARPTRLTTGSGNGVLRRLCRMPPAGPNPMPAAQRSRRPGAALGVPAVAPSFLACSCQPEWARGCARPLAPLPLPVAVLRLGVGVVL
jgi:hypothetical protein